MSVRGELPSGRARPRILSAEAVGPGLLRITWGHGDRTGLAEVVDLAPALARHRMYGRLRTDPALFATVAVVEDGLALAWDGDGLEMTAEMIEHCAGLGMTSAEFAVFLKRNRLTQEAAAAVLGRSRRQIGYYLKPGPVPRVVALACVGWEALRGRGQEVV